VVRTVSGWNQETGKDEKRAHVQLTDTDSCTAPWSVHVVVPFIDKDISPDIVNSVVKSSQSVVMELRHRYHNEHCGRLQGSRFMCGLTHCMKASLSASEGCESIQSPYSFSDQPWTYVRSTDTYVCVCMVIEHSHGKHSDELSAPITDKYWSV